MKTPARPLIRLRGRGLVDEDGRVDLAEYDALLPCRRFQVEHKVAVLGRVSLTAEFLLRLIKSIDGISETDAAAFFNFDHREASYVFAEVAGEGFVERRDGRLFLSVAGHELFREGSGQPEIFTVEKRVEKIGLDLISLAPERFRQTGGFEAWLPELRMSDDAATGTASSRVPASFRRFFHQLPARKDASGNKQSLYSIDAVTPGERFFAPVRIMVASTGLRPSAAEVDLEGWRPDHEQEDRGEVREAVLAFRAGLETPRRQDDAVAYRMLTELAPEFLADVSRGEELLVDRYYREAYTRAGEARSDRPTIPLLGSLLLRKNLGRFIEVLGYGLRRGAHPRHVFWVVPQVPHWGAVRTLPEVLSQVIDRIASRTSGPDQLIPTSACIVAGNGLRHLEKAFDDVIRSQGLVAPAAFEVMLIPGVLAAASVHAPIGSQTGMAVPLGFLSFDPKVLDRVAHLIAPAFEQFGPVEDWTTPVSQPESEPV